MERHCSVSEGCGGERGQVDAFEYERSESSSLAAGCGLSFLDGVPAEETLLMIVHTAAAYWAKTSPESPCPSMSSSQGVQEGLVEVFIHGPPPCPVISSNQWEQEGFNESFLQTILDRRAPVSGNKSSPQKSSPKPS